MTDFKQTTFFYLGKFLKKLADNQCSSITKGSIYHIKHDYVHKTFYPIRRLTRNLTFNGSIYYVLYLQILHFYLVGHNFTICRAHSSANFPLSKWI